MQKKIAAFVLVFLSFVVAMASASCSSGQAQPQMLPSAGVNLDEQGLPQVCAGKALVREYIMNAGEAISVSCSCSDKTHMYRWHRPVMAGQDPTTHCAFARTLFIRPAEAPAGSAPVPAASSSSTVLPDMPAIVAFSSSSSEVKVTTVGSSAPILPAPSAVVSSVPVASASASSVTQTAKITTRHEKYYCAEGLARRDSYVVISPGHEQSLHQECAGEGIVCLANPAEQKDTTRPPCGCTNNNTPVLVNKEQNIWGCSSK